MATPHIGRPTIGAPRRRGLEALALCHAMPSAAQARLNT